MDCSFKEISPKNLNCLLTLMLLLPLFLTFFCVTKYILENISTYIVIVYYVYSYFSLFIVIFFSPNSKRKYKDKKFGFGGKKKGTKWNTKDSHDDISGFKAKMAHGKGGKHFGKGGKTNVSALSFFFFKSVLLL